MSNELVEQFRVTRRDRIAAEVESKIATLGEAMKERLPIDTGFVDRLLTTCWDYTTDYRDTYLFPQIKTLEWLNRSIKLAQTKEK